MLLEDMEVPVEGPLKTDTVVSELSSDSLSTCGVSAQPISELSQLSMRCLGSVSVPYEV